MWNLDSFKATGKANFKANYWPFVGVSLLLGILTGAFYVDTPEITYHVENLNIDSVEQFYYTVEPFLNLLAPAALLSGLGGIALHLLVTNPFEVGACRFFLESTTFHKGDVGRIGMGFSVNYGNVVLTQFLKNLFIFLWSLLFLVPGIVRAFGYFAVPYILAENPNLDHDRALTLSREMTMGYKGDLFILEFSFLGWYLLNCLTLGILGIFYVNPYLYGTRAEAYRFLRAKAFENGITNPMELPGMGAL